MLKELIINDIFKQKRTKLILTVVAIPIFVSFLLFVDLRIRYISYLRPLSLKEGRTSWQMLLHEQNIVYFKQYLPIFGAMIISSMFDNEYKNNAWTLSLIYPVKRRNIIISKFITSLLFMVVMLSVNVIGLILVGKVSGFPEPVNVEYFAKMFGIQFMAAAAVMVIHLFITLKNKNTLISIGIAAIISIVSSNLYFNKNIISKYNPYSFASYSDGLMPVNLNTIIIIEMVIIIVGLVFVINYFNRKQYY
ncbi:ABC transporter permease [Clostridium felsineum]|uniref:Uncharacterized protein n=1 Tax=Clostridium felsineum TaxID=36839 RepID=A0A1S8LZY4_9CLOT|nr:ABC transporter permease [Clostridium felsineum]URZ05177.1 hypothetical protein CLROS_005010 [Clostridium felsineum]URZ10218.1 hypothetical protein CROST_009260 [Clostridium felsineum]